jgi:hypothetical protein
MILDSALLLYFDFLDSYVIDGRKAALKAETIPTANQRSPAFALP